MNPIKQELLLKIAALHEALAEAHRQLAGDNPELQSPTIREKAKEPLPGVHYCKHRLEARRIDGIAKSGKNAGKPYIMFVCPKERNEACDYREFEDVKENAQAHVRADIPGDSIPF